MRQEHSQLASHIRADWTSGQWHHNQRPEPSTTVRHSAGGLLGNQHGAQRRQAVQDLYSRCAK